MNVLSLFDGMSCGQIALNRLGIKVDNYYASEIDKYAIEVANRNYPDTIQLGDVIKVNGSKLPQIDLLFGGSPCQGFSFAGKQLNFNDPRSALFFEFVRLLKECKPKYFLLENVRMKQEYQDIISQYLGVKPIAINSSLVSAQNRHRLYWTNIQVTSLPDDQRIILSEILEDNVNGEYQEPYVKLNGKTSGQIGFVGKKTRQSGRIYSTDGKSATIRANGGGQGANTGLYQIKCGAIRGRQLTLGSSKYTQMIEVREDCKTNTLTTVKKDNVVIGSESHYRKLTPTECERLQTVPDGYTLGVSNTQRYKMLGNGWTVDVIVHLLKNIKEEAK